jgi:hypothetical protein
MHHVKEVLIEFLRTMVEDLKRRSFDESGEQKAETLGRINQLQDLIKELEGDL